MSLLTLPDELLWQCLPACRFEKRDSIRETCRRLGDLILQQLPVYLQIPLQDEDLDEQDWRQSLRRILGLCPGVRCVRLGDYETELTDEELRKCFLGDMPAPPPGATWPQNPTAFLTHLTLHSITTAQRVPDVIATMCPKLKRLKLYWPDIKPAAVAGQQAVPCRPRIPWGAPVPASLALSWHDDTASDMEDTATTTTTPAPVKGSSGSMGAQAASHTKKACSVERLTVHVGTITIQSTEVVAQLRALTNLRHLDWAITYGNRGHWGGMMQAVGQQLTQLRMTSWKTEIDGPSMRWRIPKDFSPLVSLVDLRIAVVVTDAIMQQLLQQLPHVQQLHVDSFKITEDYSSRQCSWQGVFMRHVIIATLPLLPLAKVKWLGYDVWAHWGSQVTLPAPADGSAKAIAAAIAVTLAAVAVAAACGGMQATGARIEDAIVQIRLPKHYTEEQLLACLPLLQPLVCIELMAPGLSSYQRTADGEVDDGNVEEPDLQQRKRLDISLAAVTALGKHLPHLNQVRFKHCCFGKGVLTNITRVLPKLDKVVFSEHCFECISQMILLCGCLTRKVEVFLPAAEAQAFDSDYKRLINNAIVTGEMDWNMVHWME